MAAAHPDWIAFFAPRKVAPESLHYTTADMLLTPSLHEPCGLPHTMGLRYGTIPIVRQTGGLADVMQGFDPSAWTGNGLVFQAPDVQEMLHAIGRALEYFCQQTDVWQALATSAMRAKYRRGHDFTWPTAASRCLTELYEMRGQTHMAKGHPLAS